MAHRSRKKQEAHDKGVLAEARELDREEWEVKADHVSGHGFETPPKINGHRPDIYATKRGRHADRRNRNGPRRRL